MTVLCDKCGKGYFVRRAVGRTGHLLRLACPHCGQLLWSSAVRPVDRTRAGDPPTSIQTRGFS
jgi:hypothetical protein